MFFLFLKISSLVCVFCGFTMKILLVHLEKIFYSYAANFVA